MADCHHAGLQEKLDKLKEQYRSLQEESDQVREELARRPSSAAHQRVVEAAASLQTLIGHQMDAEGWGNPSDLDSQQLDTLHLLQVILISNFAPPSRPLSGLGHCPDGLMKQDILGAFVFCPSQS